MPLFKVEIIEERTTFTFIRATDAAAARTVASRASRDGEIDWFGDGDIFYSTGAVEELSEVPAGFEVDFDEIEDGFDVEDDIEASTDGIREEKESDDA